MTQTLRKAFDLGIAAAVAVVIMNFAVSSIGFGNAEAQTAEITDSVSFSQAATFTVASLGQ